MATLKDGEFYSGLEGNQTLVYAVTHPLTFSTELLRLSDQKISL